MWLYHRSKTVSGPALHYLVLYSLCLPDTRITSGKPDSDKSIEEFHLCLSRKSRKGRKRRKRRKGRKNIRNKYRYNNG